MAIVAPTPESLEGTRLFGLLTQRPDHEEIAHKLRVFEKSVSPQLDLILAGPFSAYTLHNKAHSLKLVHLVPYIVPDRTLSYLCPLEMQIFICAAFLHDLGMSLTSTELSRLVESSDYLESVRGWPELWADIENCRSMLKSPDMEAGERSQVELRLAQLHNAGVANYLRPIHAVPSRYLEILPAIYRAAGTEDLFAYRGVSFVSQLVDVCASHMVPVSQLLTVHDGYEMRYPDDALIAGQKVNVRFLACLLRITDVMDFDRERTPRLLFESLGIANRAVPGADLSLNEWNKHLAVHSIEIASDEIVYAGVSKHPVIEKTVRDFCITMEREIRDTTAITKRFSGQNAEAYQIDLPLCVRPRIQSEGYTFKDFALTLNHKAVANLLMGERLYSHAEAALRELIQNAEDACLARRELSQENYTPEIVLDAYVDGQGRRWLRVRDNGIGMDEHVLSEYFLKLGNTYYNSLEFERSMSARGRKPSSFVPISRFGVGIASVFMIADIMEIETRRFLSPRHDESHRFLRIERLGSLAYVLESGVSPAGTEVRLRLKREFDNDNFLADCITYLKEMVVRPEVPVSVRILWTQTILQRTHDLKVTTFGKDALEARGIVTVHLDLSRWSDLLGGTVIVFLARNGGKLSLTKDGRKLIMAAHPSSPYAAHVNPYKVLQGYTGNRVVVNGFRMSLRKMAKVFGDSKRRLLCVFDIDVKGTHEIAYDVSRDRIVHEGVSTIKNEVRQSVLRGLTELGIWDQLDDDSRPHVKQHLSHEDTTSRGTDAHWKTHPTELTDDVLEKVRGLLPNTPWPVNIHKTIAKTIGVSRRTAYAAVSHLVNKGVVVVPKADKAG